MDGVVFRSRRSKDRCSAAVVLRLRVVARVIFQNRGLKALNARKIDFAAIQEEGMDLVRPFSYCLGSAAKNKIFIGIDLLKRDRAGYRLSLF